VTCRDDSANRGATESDTERANFLVGIDNARSARGGPEEDKMGGNVVAADETSTTDWGAANTFAGFIELLDKTS